MQGNETLDINIPMPKQFKNMLYLSQTVAALMYAMLACKIFYI